MSYEKIDISFDRKFFEGIPTLKVNFSLIRACDFCGARFAMQPANNFPHTLNCSSFVQGVYSSLGIKLPKYTVQQIEVGKLVSKILSLKSLQAGDLLFFHGKNPDVLWKSENGKKVSHVCIYLGDGKFIDASRKRFENGEECVMETNFIDLKSRNLVFVEARRYFKNEL
jgi:hypothetical protein